MSGTEEGATTKYNKAGDIIIRVAINKLDMTKWEKVGAGKDEGRSKEGIPRELLA
jgi:hypothetical protein